MYLHEEKKQLREEKKQLREEQLLLLRKSDGRVQSVCRSSNNCLMLSVHVL